MTPHNASDILEGFCRMAPVIPVLVIEDAARARPLAEALRDGGLTVLEVTLRTPVALEAIRRIADVPGVIVGAGTLLAAEDVREAVAVGARFGVSPGATPALLDACETAGLPLLPGAATASEVMALRARGYRVLKFFPAGSSGGAAALRALAGPFPDMRFCPTGGIGPSNAAEYLALDTVLCVGGSWVAPPAMVAAGDWADITGLARQAARLR
ncbi:bifunctional 4-hydroxy-2-oxoglutarate aldolase/2-dehydro-3-deoxy-phosphogluconate aldolase [Alkalilacustris brevis]|uniref:bifunctional 4-hydroxy-2-oxoglutarate aldolase/2-dehydro-3-deoxy-phosphogluconate aldolase n=1 Tax=Alkalilacustris brevis TaxID=2026338 RepID=UPI000E0CE08F|nr:bifunctional 4-hydroxy-2-oxoglutarate aldolase/2-dehydro-3-deoxy-phosphogluconate aldolase [Alkalilacustris brevis]